MKQKNLFPLSMPWLNLVLAGTSGHGLADPAQGAVLGGAVGGAAGAAAGAVLGGIGGAHSQARQRADQERWKDYYQQQSSPAQSDTEPTTGYQQPRVPMPSGSGLIKEIQRSLTRLGYTPGQVEGLTDGKTVDAIRTCQEDNGLMTTGKPSQDLLLHLRERLEHH